MRAVVVVFRAMSSGGHVRPRGGRCRCGYVIPPLSPSQPLSVAAATAARQPVGFVGHSFMNVWLAASFCAAVREDGARQEEQGRVYWSFQDGNNHTWDTLLFFLFIYCLRKDHNRSCCLVEFSSESAFSV